MPGDLTALGHQGQLSLPTLEPPRIPGDPQRFARDPVGLACDRQAAGFDRDLTGDGLQQGAFAGAVGSHQGGEAAGGQLEADVLKYQATATPHTQPSDVEGGGWRQDGRASGATLAIKGWRASIMFEDLPVEIASG